jgi:hypothetical protein
MRDWIFDKQRSLEVNKARMNHLASLEPYLNLYYRSVLEVGAGIGLLTGFWEKRGCTVTSLDGRLSCIRENLRRHPHRVGTLRHADLKTRFSSSIFGQFGVTFAYGILYLVPAVQLPDIIAELAAMTRELMLVSMIVQRKDTGTIEALGDNPEVPDSSLDGRRCRVSRNWFMDELKKHFEFAYITRTQPKDGCFPTEWPPKQHNPRCIFVASRHVLDGEVFSDVLLSEQTK